MVATAPDLPGFDHEVESYHSLENQPPLLEQAVTMIAPALNAMKFVFPEHLAFSAIASFLATAANADDVPAEIFRARLMSLADVYETKRSGGKR